MDPMLSCLMGLLTIVLMMLGGALLFQMIETRYIWDILGGLLPTKLRLLIRWIRKNRNLSFVDTLQLLAEEIESAAKADLVILYVFDKDQYRFAVASRSVSSPLAKKYREVPRSVLSIKINEKPKFWTESSRKTLVDPNYSKFEDYKAVIGVPLKNKGELVGVLMIYYRKAERYGLTEQLLIEVLAREVSPIVGEIILEKAELELVGQDVLRLQFQFPSTIQVEDYFDNTGETLKAISFIYLLYRLVASENTVGLEKVLRSLIDLDPRRLSFADFIRIWPRAKVESLRIVSVHYGSPGSFDFLGIGKILEVLRDTIKDLIWRGKHEKKMAELERKSKQEELSKFKREETKFLLDLDVERAELARKKLENERLYVEIIDKSLDAMKKAYDLQLTDETRQLLTTILLPKIETVAEAESITVPVSEAHPTFYPNKLLE